MKSLLIGRIILIITIVGFSAYAQEIGGPYTKDDNTMLLMHFDGNLANEADYSADGEFHGDLSNFYFIFNWVPGLGECLRIDNDSNTDQAYVTVPDTQYLDLTGDWTIEGWINIFTFGQGADDWRWVPRLVIKTGDEAFWQPNYFVEMWGSTRFFSCGYHTASQDQWPQANSPDNTMIPGQWYHMAFIRDSNRHILMTIIHNENRQLLSFTVVDYLLFNAADPTPITTNQPLHIGYAGGGTDSYLDGFVDEIRISNVVREYAAPPIITDVTQIPNQEASVPGYWVGANVFTLFSTTIEGAKLYYDVGAGWQSIDMQAVEGDSMGATIPQQPSGTIIKYYVEAVDNEGRSFSYPKELGWGGAEYFTFGIYTPMTLTLDLPFEEGTGDPKDVSDYANPVTVAGAPTYSSEAAAGNYALQLEGDSSYLEIVSPFLACEEFCVDFWFNTEQIGDYCRILNKANSASIWYDNNYQIRFNDGQQLQAISDGEGRCTFTTTETIELNKWYHVVYEVMKAPEEDTVVYYGAFRLSDENDQEIYFNYMGFDTQVILAQGPVRIGKAGPTDPGSYPPFFKGRYDEVKIYNYAAVGLMKEIVSVKPNNYLPLKFELAQNYPNPFNPTTEIRFTIPEQQKVTLTVYNLLGREVKTLVDKHVIPGIHRVSWDGTDQLGTEVASGVYFYKLKTKDVVKVKKMLLLR